MFTRGAARAAPFRRYPRIKEDVTVAASTKKTTAKTKTDKPSSEDERTAVLRRLVAVGGTLAGALLVLAQAMRQTGPESADPPADGSESEEAKPQSTV